MLGAVGECIHPLTLTVHHLTLKLTCQARDSYSPGPLPLGPPAFPREGSWLSPNKELRGMCVWREESGQSHGGPHLVLPRTFRSPGESGTTGAKLAGSDIPGWERVSGDPGGQMGYPM